MKLKKIIIDGKEYYVEVLDDNETVSGNEQKQAEEKADEDVKEDNDVKEEKKENENFNLGDSIQEKVGKIIGKINNTIDKSINFTFDKFNLKDDSRNPKSKTSKLLKLLPFMDDDDIHELMEQILNNDESIKDLKIGAILPFLSTSDCDALFLKALKDGNTNYKAEEIAPFVSADCLSVIIDKYLEGEIDNLNLDAVYPFLNSKDIKRVFTHILNQKED